MNSKPNGIWISPDFFETDLRLPDVADDPDVRIAVEWLTSFMREGEWKRRRFAALERFVNAASGQSAPGASGDNRFFATEDQLAWYLFLAQGSMDHPMVYDFIYGSRVVPIFRAIGRSITLLQSVPGVESRIRRLVDGERAQPNGGLFELLVAAAYCREGAGVRFLTESPGNRKTHDFDVSVGGREWAVECKRMETGEYTDRERQSARQLWLPTARDLQRRGLSVLAQVHFRSELCEVPSEYLAYQAGQWLQSGVLKRHEWDDQYGAGVIGTLDLRPLTRLLRTDDVAIHSSRMMELLTGRYKRNANVIQLLNVKMADNPLYVEGCQQAIVLDWESTSDTAIDRKARDVVKRLADATKQLPNDRPGLIHIGLEAVDGDEVEARRYEKIFQTVRNFDSKGKRLEYIYVHWFAPESPPTGPAAFDETYFWSGRQPDQLRPLRDGMLVLPPETETRDGLHWDAKLPSVRR